MIEGINVVSFFDGMSCGQIALERAEIKVNNYYASEIKSHAIKCCKENYPKTDQLGDINDISYYNGIISSKTKLRNVGSIGGIDLIIGGSPCQDITVLKPNKNIFDDKSRLFFEFLRFLNSVQKEKPEVLFLLENVVGDKKSIETITQLLKVEPIKINSNLVSFQNRNRYYWTNIPNITIPEDRGISYQDYKDTDEAYIERFKVNRTPSRDIMWGNGVNGKCPNVTHRDKINCLTVKQDRWSNSGLVEYKDFCRYLTTRELELAQTVPLGYTSCLTKNQSEDLLGDGWTVEVVAHIFKHMKP